MKKTNLLQKSFIMLILASFVIPFSNAAYASESATPLTQEAQAEVSPLWVYDYIETITVTYPTAAAIPNEIHYEYYHDVYGWMRGVLKYQKHDVVKGKYVATFTGRMYSNPL